jgi:uncharacterized integral membrane protein
VSVPTQTPGSTTPQARRTQRERIRTGAIAVLAVLITLFAVFNLDKVKVHWVFGTDEAPLIIVIVISLLVGILLTHFTERWAKGRSRTGKRRG